MQIKLWGVRGSLASPTSNKEYRTKIHEILEHAIDAGLQQKDDIGSFIDGLPSLLKYVYGGNTTCITVTSKNGNTYIVDCGSGIRPLGDELMKGSCGKGEGVLKILLTHNHWDHIQGLPFFKPLYIEGNLLKFYSPYKNQEEILKGQMVSPYFPATFDGTPSSKEYYYLDPKERPTLELEDGLLVDYYPLKHPGGSFAYRFKEGDRTFIFATDAEFTGEILESVESKSDFFEDADLLILDSQYTLDESFMKIDWGHTSYTMAVNCAIRWNVKTLAMTHHEPAYDDKKLYENYLGAVEHRDNSRSTTPEIVVATEGMVFDL